MNRRHQHGITHLEIMIVVIILSIVAAVSMPNLAINDGRKLDVAASEVAEAIRFTRTEAMRKGAPYGVTFDTNNNRVKIYELVCTVTRGFTVCTPTYNVYHPVDKKLYTLSLKTDAVTKGVELQSYGLYYGGSGTNQELLGFNAHGNPKYTSGSTDLMLDSGTITLAYAGQTKVISIAPMTGRVTVQ